MPRKPDELRAQIKRLEAVVKADNAERRAAEAPLRKQRSTLKERVRLLKHNVMRTQAHREDMLSQGWKAFKLTPLTEEEAKYLNGSKWTNNAAALERYTADLASAELDLELFNTQHPELT